MRQHLRVIRALQLQLQAQSKEIANVKPLTEEHAKLLKAHERQITQWDREVTRFLKKDWTGPKGDTGIDGKDGADGLSPDINFIVTAVLERMPILAGKDGNDALVDEDKVIEAVIEKIVKEKRIDVSNIRNAEGFMFNKKKYKFEELMRGGGGGTTTGGLTVTTQYLLTAVQVGSDVTIALSQLSHFATFSQAITFTKNNMPQTYGAAFDFTITGGVLTAYNCSDADAFNLVYSYA